VDTAPGEGSTFVASFDRDALTTEHSTPEQDLMSLVATDAAAA
jgi:hypothetical protein